MSKGGSSGGGQSSLGYLFGSDQPPTDEQPSSPMPAAQTTKLNPPWGDNNTEERPKLVSPSKKPNNNFSRSQGRNLGNVITDRPSTKVKSVPGGDSSLGYLFGDK